MQADILQQRRAPTCKQALHVGTNGNPTPQLTTILTGRTIEFCSKVRVELHAPTAVERHLKEATQAATLIAAEEKKPKRKGKDDV